MAPAAEETASAVTAARIISAPLPETYQLECGGQPRTLRLALDEAMLRGADGKDTIQLFARLRATPAAE